MLKMFMMEKKISLKAPLRNTEEREDVMDVERKESEKSDVDLHASKGLNLMRYKQKVMWGSGHGCDLYGSFNVASNQGWGIPPGLGLRGGGLNSLNNGTSGWGAPPSNSSAASATGWGAPPGPASVVGSGSSSSSVVGSAQSSVASATTSSSSSSGGLVNTPANTQQVNPPANSNHPGGSNQWASTSPNRNTSQNTNGQPTISGSQMNNNPSSNATSAPNPMQMGNQNVNNVMSNNSPNSPMNPGCVGTNTNPNSGPGSTNSTGLITNAGTSSWAQAAGKSLQSTNGNNNNTMNNANNPSNTSAISNNPNAINANTVNTGVTGHGPSMSGITSASQPGSSGSSSVTSKQIEQLNSMRDALFSHDGWGGQNVNQDSGWDIPGSPEPQHKDLSAMSGASSGGTGATTSWKVNINNGTDLWEANLRNGGAPPPQPATQKAPWGHTPSTNIGGTWGEEDDGADSSNVWTGVPPASNAPGPNAAPPTNNPSAASASGQQQQQQQQQWGSINNGPQQPPPQREPPNGMWSSAPAGTNKEMLVKKDDWNTNIGRGHAGQEMGRGHDNAPSGWSNNPRGGMNNGSMGVDPNQGMWGKPPQQQPPPQPQNQWGGGPPGHIGPGTHGAHVGMKDKPSNSGWDDSPPTQRRAAPNIPNYDDGTSLWGNPMPQQQQPQQPPQRIPPNRGMPNKMDNSIGNPMWGHGGGGNSRNGGWSGPDGPQDGFNSAGAGGWNDDKNAGGSWGEPPMQQQHSSWGKPKTPTNPSSGWGDEALVDTTSWSGAHKNSRSRYDYANGNGNFAKDASRPLKILADLGFKKEDLELALRTSHMNLTDAIESLDNLTVSGGGRGGPPMDQSPWGGGPLQPHQQRRGPPPGGPGLDDHFDLGNVGVGPGGPMGMGHPAQPRGGFPNPGGIPVPNVIVNNAVQPNVAGINPTLIHKILTQQNPNPPQPFNAQQRVAVPNNVTSPAQVRLLVQQIQMAVQAGYLNSQILQHPLSQQSLLLLNQLLQQIKIFQQVTQAHQQVSKTNSAAALTLSVQITKTKQHINNLHNQIAAQQAMHVKQQQQQQQQQQHNHLMAAAAAAAANKPNDFFNNPPILPNNTGSLDPLTMSALHSNFSSEFGLKESGQHQQSRLTQWTKVPSLEKDDANNSGNEFSRAPGPQSNNSASLLKNNSSFNLGQSDNTWSSVTSRSGGDGWPTDTPPTSNASGNNSSNINMNDDSNKPNSAVNINADAWPSDLVPEFEPGKPWKGTQILKSPEDDPTITPGSVARSPLSLAAIKDNSEMFSKNNSPPTAVSSIASDPLVTPLSLSSNTWSFPTPTSSSNSGMTNKTMKTVKGPWDDMRPRDLWDYGTGASAGNAVPGSRPPPGLPKKTGGPSTPVPTASGIVTSGTNSNSFNSYRNNTASWGGNQGGGMSHLWLLLRNLTPQIDGSTLKTLCLQHGPLQNFHLYLGHGVALVRYSSREEAAKAQHALNNCVLGNTTILAETAGEADVLNLIQGLNGGAAVNNSQPASNNSGISSGNNSSRQSSTDNPWNVLRDSSPLWSSSPWGTAGLDAPDRATPSSLNSLLPGDLLGGESA